MVRRGLFVCLKGTVRIVKRDLHGFYSRIIGGEEIYGLVIVAPGTPCAIYNYGDEEALVLNMPSPAWSKEEPDEWPVEGWQDPEDWESQHALAPV